MQTVDISMGARLVGQCLNSWWFTKNLPTETIDDIELRLCTNYDLASADVPIELIELYVQ